MFRVNNVREGLLEIHSPDFKKFLSFLFTFNLEKKDQKTLPYEVYEAFFKQLFGNQFKLVDTFLEFMQTEKKKEKMTQDQWNLFLELLKTIGDQFPKNYNLEEAWPTLFDEFFTWYCNKNGIKIEPPRYE